MTTAKEHADHLFYRMKNLQEWVVERDIQQLPSGVCKYTIQHKQGQLAKIHVHAIDMAEAETLVDNWLNEDES